jgi:hypothetical protein
VLKLPYVGSHFGSKHKHFVKDYPRHILVNVLTKVSVVSDKYYFEIFFHRVQLQNIFSDGGHLDF